MPLNLPFLKRHSDPAPCSSTSSKTEIRRAPKSARSAPDLRRAGSSPSPSRSPAAPKRTPTPSPSRKTPTRTARAVKYRRLSSSSTSSATTTADYFNTTPRRATHPTTSPRRLRRSSLWLENEKDPWSEFRNKYMKTVLPNNDDKSLAANNESPEGCYRLRSFSVTSRGIINLGDFLRVRSYSDACAPADMPEIDDVILDCNAGNEASGIDFNNKYRVLLLGDEGVGKTSIVAQFTTSESLTSMTDPQASIDGTEERTVCLLVDGEESELVCEDPTYYSYEVDDSVYSSTDAFLVVYAVTDVKSFQYAHKILRTLRKMKSKANFLYSETSSKTIILVANKIDLVRCRLVSTEEGRSLADAHNVKYIETSVGFNHNVDELLVGIVTQMRLHRKQKRNTSFHTAENKNIISRSLRFTTSKARDLMDKFLQKCDLKTKSCDNLNVL